MSQFFSRLHIKVSSPKVWNRFEKNFTPEIELTELAGTDKTSFVIDEWSFKEGPLTGIVHALANVLGEDGIVIADVTYIDVDPNNYCIYYLGDSVHVREFNIYRWADRCAMHFETNIEDMAGWLNYGRFKASPKEKEVLFRCGISSTKGQYESFSTKLEIPELVYLRETSFKERPNRIEEIAAGEEVSFVQAKDSYDPLRIEVMGTQGSLGYLPSDVSEQLTPLLIQNKLKYTAQVAEVVPVSKRNKHAKSAIVGLYIDAEVSMKEPR